VSPNEEQPVEKATISADFSVEIPRTARDILDLRPGQEVQIYIYDGRIEAIPTRRPAEMRGFLSGMSMHFERESD
jgi:bifunctional DNA-binding transcriptional regulator/antitoxin component of YhaV-PrlF toxin-antitoxin module